MAKWSYHNPRPSIGMLLQFPDHQHRAWVIRPVGDGNYRAYVEPGLDPADELPGRTAEGSLYLVTDVLRRETGNRRGLPVTFGEGAE